jgi:hypothetical protein
MAMDLILPSLSLMMYPHHATHSLQALDVVMFKSLSSHCSKKLTNHIHKSLGILPVKKGDFVPIFWSAWVSFFTEKTHLQGFWGHWGLTKKQECCTQKVQTQAIHQSRQIHINHGV